MHFKVRIPKNVLGLSLDEDSDFDKKENPAVDLFEGKRASMTPKPNANTTKSKNQDLVQAVSTWRKDVVFTRTGLNFDPKE